jgi:hypothetical protein
MRRFFFDRKELRFGGMMPLFLVILILSNIGKSNQL